MYGFYSNLLKINDFADEIFLPLRFSASRKALSPSERAQGRTLEEIGSTVEKSVSAAGGQGCQGCRLKAGTQNLAECKVVAVPGRPRGRHLAKRIVSKQCHSIHKNPRAALPISLSSTTLTPAPDKGKIFRFSFLA
jgi:hypothetical protein